MSQLNVYFTQEEKEKLKTDAKNEGLKAGQFLKRLWKVYMKGKGGK